MFRPVTTIRTQMTSNLPPIVITSSRLLSNSSFEISDHTIVLRRATIRTIRIQTPSQICIPSPPSSSSSSSTSSASCFYNNFVTPYIQIETDDDDDNDNDNDDDDDVDVEEEDDADKEEDEGEINQVDGEEEHAVVNEHDNLVENDNVNINIDDANQHMNINGNVNVHDDDDHDVDIDYDIGNNAYAAAPQQPLNIVAINSYFRSSGYASFDIDTLRELNIVDDRQTYRKIPWHLLPAEEKRRIFAESRAYGHLNFLNVTESI